MTNDATPIALHVRPATPADDAFFAELYASTRDDLRAMLADPRYIDGLIAMQRDMQVAGYRTRYPDARYEVLELDGAAAGRLVTAAVDGALRVVDIAVMPWARGRGVAGEALRRLQRQAARDGLDVTLGVRIDNASARSLYAALGFVQESEEGGSMQLRWRERPDRSTAARANPTTTPECIWDAGAHLGEGALWHPAQRMVYFVDIKDRRIHRCAPDGSARSRWDAPGQPGFVVPASDGGLVCALEDGLYRFDAASSAFTAMRKVEDDLPGNRFNDGHVDAGGNLWFGSMDDAQGAPSGALYRLGSDGRLTQADTGYIITNGPAISPDGRTLYHTDTPLRRVYAFDLRPDGALANKRVFLQLPEGSRPDGMAVDSEGIVWIALFGAGRIERYTAAGRLVGEVRFPCFNITKLAFGGDDLRTVYVTTAWKGLNAAQRAEQPLAGGLFAFRSDTPGQPHHAFAAA